MIVKVTLILPLMLSGASFAQFPRTFTATAPAYPGVNQVNVRMPGGIAPGPAIPVRLSYLGRPSNAVTVGVQ